MTPDEREAAPCFQNCGHLVSDGPCSKCGWKKTPDILIQHLTERNIESKVLAVIHAYDETAESKLSRIWQILGEKA